MRNSPFTALLNAVHMVSICCSVSVLPLKKQQKIGVEYFLLKFIMHRDRLVKGRETRHDESTRRLPYCTNMAEKNDKKTTLQLLHDTVICNRCRIVFLSFFSIMLPQTSKVVYLCFHPALFLYFLQSTSTCNQLLQKTFNSQLYDLYIFAFYELCHPLVSR